MNCGGSTSSPSWGTTNDQIATQTPSGEATSVMLHLTVDDHKLKSVAKDVKEENGTQVEAMVNAAGNGMFVFILNHEYLYSNLKVVFL